jgi:hypothetical protein
LPRAARALAKSLAADTASFFSIPCIRTEYAGSRDIIRNQRLVRIVFVKTALQADSGRPKYAFPLQTFTAPLGPTAIHSECQIRCQQARERRRNGGIGDDIPVAHGVFSLGEVRKDQLIRDGRVVKGQGAGKVSIAGDAVCLNRRRRQGGPP